MFRLLTLLLISASLFCIETSSWICEYKIARSLATEGDYHNAAIACKRALILLPEEESVRKELEYARLLAHYKDSDYSQVIHVFETSSLLYADAGFLPYQDLLLLLHDSYERLHECVKADLILEKIEYVAPELIEGRHLLSALFRKNLSRIELLSKNREGLRYLSTLVKKIEEGRKSPKIAGMISILVPGAGYFYGGQKKTGLTSFMINALLMISCWQLFAHQYYALGVLCMTFELGWYIGGILGSKEAVNLYNELLYKRFSEKVISQEHLLPRDSLQYEF